MDYTLTEWYFRVRIPILLTIVQFDTSSNKPFISRAGKSHNS